MATLTPSAKQQFFDANGNPLAGGKLYTYAAGTTIPLATYTDSSGNTPNANPIILDSRGEANIWLGAFLYKFKLTTSTDVEVWTVDNIETASTDVLSQLAASGGASLVGFIQSGSGATQRSVQAKLRDVVSVKDFGAVGDGITDDTNAISNAIATGKNVFFPAGTYLSDTQEITTANQTLFGEGASSIILAKTAGNNLLYVKANHVTIKEIRLNGAEVNATNSSFAIFTSSSTPADFLTVRNVIISGASASYGFNNGVKFDSSCNNGLVNECFVERLWGNLSGRGYSVLAGNVVGCQVTKNQMLASSGRGRHAVYFSAGCSDSICTENYIKNFDQEGISQYSTGAQPTCARNIYANNVLVGCCAAGNNAFSGAIGIYQHSFGAVIANNTITASVERGITVDGSGVSDCANTLISGNTISYCATNGINLTSVVRANVIGNIVFDCSTEAAGTYSNIMIRTDGTYASSNVLIEGNISAGNTYARSAIGVDPGPPTPTSLKFLANDFQPGTVATIELNGVSGIWIDGRIQFRFDGTSYGPIANGDSFTGPLVLTGAAQGDVCTVSHTSGHDGCIFSAQVTSTNTGVLTIGNLSGTSKTISSGTLRVDVWKRNTPL